MWYNSKTGECQSNPPWSGYLSAAMQAAMYSDWSQVADDFTPTIVLSKQQRIMAANQDALVKIAAKEKYYTAVITSSLYTDSEVTSIVSQIKADKLSIYNDLKTQQEAIINE